MQDAGAVERRSFERRMAVVFAADFVTIGVFSPFFPVWLAGKGLSADDIGIVLAAQIALRVLAVPVVLRLADRAPDRAYILIFAGVTSALAVNFLFLTDSFGPILAATLLVAVLWSPLVPLSDAIALSGVRRLAADYGRSRLWGSLAFIAANITGGALIGAFGAGSILPLLSVVFALAAAGTLFAPRVGRPRRPSTPMPDTDAASPSPTRIVQKLMPRADVLPLLPAMLALAMVQASHAMFYGFGAILWTRMDYSGAAIGLFWAIGVTAEILLFRFSAGLMTRQGARWLLLASGAAGVLRWFLMGFDLGFAGFALLQVLHGLTFGAAWLALQALIGTAVAEDRLGAAQGAGFALQTALMAVATLLSGPVFAAYGAQGFWMMAAMAGLGLLIGLAQPQSSGRGGDTVEAE